MELYDYQQQLIDTVPMKAVLPLPTGSGKTLISLEIIMRHQPLTDVIVFTPKAKVKEGGWQREVAQCDFVADISIRTIDSILKLTDEEIESHAFIFDECHKYKGRSMRGKKFIETVLKCKNVCLCLSATPISNNWEDAVNYFAAFNRKDIVYISRQKKAYYHPQFVTYERVKFGANAFNRIHHFNQTDVLEKAWSEFNYSIDKSALVKLPNRAFEDITFKETKEAVLIRTDKVFNGELYDNPSKVLHGMRIYSNVPDKLEYLKMLIEDDSRNYIVFYQYNAHYDAIFDLCKQLKKVIWTVNGSKNLLPDKNVWEKVNNSVTIAQVQAGGAGIELTYATEVIFFTGTYSYQDYEQCLGRNYRIGQANHVTVYRFITDGIEREVFNCLNDKKDFSEKVYYSTLTNSGKE